MQKLTVIAMAILSLTSAVNAQTVLNSHSRGTKSSIQDIFQLKQPSISVGRDTSFIEFNEDFTNFASFDVSQLDTVESAYLEYDITGYRSNDMMEQFSVFNFFDSGNSLPIDLGMANLSGGIELGSEIVLATDVGSVLRVDLNQEGIDQINNSTDGFATFIGGITSLDQSNQRISFRSEDSSAVRLVIETPLLGDVNRDFVVDFSDIGPFIEVLSFGYQIEADFNDDGLINFNDIGPFIEALSS